MPQTCHLYWQLDLQKHEVARVHADAQALAKAMETLVTDFCGRHHADIDEYWPAINDVLSDLTDAACSRFMDDITRLEHQLADIEAADLRRSSPVTL